MKYDPAWNTERARKLVTSELLGRAILSNLPYEQPDGQPLRVATDYLGRSRKEANPTPGPFEKPGGGEVKIKVW